MDEKNFDWILNELEDIAYKELSESINSLLNDDSKGDIYGVVLVNGSGIELRYQTREGLSALAKERAESCNVSVEDLETLLRWQVDTFQVETASLSKTIDVADKVSNRVWDLIDAAMEGGAQDFSEAHSLQEDVQDKTQKLFLAVLEKIVSTSPNAFDGTSAWPVGVSYQEYNPDTDEFYKYMSQVSGDAVVNHYKQLGVRSLVSVLDTHVKDELNTFFDNLSQSVFEEAKAGFEKIIQEFSEEEIYWLCLYHNGDCTGYISLSFATERGLDAVAKQYARHSQLGLEDNRKKLRWSPCDSPHHCEMEEDMEDTEDLLSDLEGLLMDVDENLAERLNLEPFDDLMTEVHCEIAERVHQLLIAQLKRVSETPVIADYVNKTACVLWVTAGDTSHDPVSDIALIHDRDVADRVAGEMEASNSLSTKESDLQDEKVKQDEESPPEPSFSQSDFDDLVEQFNPTFFEKDGCIFARGLGDLLHYGGDSGAEAGHNSFDLMGLLKASPFYDELDKLYGHFIGVQFKVDDFLPALARRFVKKLENALKVAYPEKSFVIYLEVSRGSRYRFEFYQNRQDGFTGGFKSERVNDGVSEYRVVGNVPMTVKFPIGLYKNEGRSYAMVFGITSMQLHTDKSLSEHSIVCEGKDYDEACWHVREALLDHLNTGYHQSMVELDYIFYPPVAVPEPSQGLNVASPMEIYDEIEFWRMIEVVPDFLTQKLVQE